MMDEKKIKQLEEQIKRQQNELTEYYRTEKVIIAAGLLSEEKFEQAHEIVRSFQE